jgi:hypothetical protein
LEKERLDRKKHIMQKVRAYYWGRFFVLSFAWTVKRTIRERREALDADYSEKLSLFNDAIIQSYKKQVLHIFSEIWLEKKVINVLGVGDKLVAYH